MDVLVNNAGLMALAPLDKTLVDEWDQMVDVNIKGVLYGVAAALPVFARQRTGHIINLASVAGHKVTMGGAVYCATKHAVRAISEGIRQEVDGIRTTIISPGAVQSELPLGISDHRRPPRDVPRDARPGHRPPGPPPRRGTRRRVRQRRLRRSNSSAACCSNHARILRHRACVSPRGGVGSASASSNQVRARST